MKRNIFILLFFCGYNILYTVIYVNIFNCHTHTMYSHDGNGTVDELCRSALGNKLMGFAVTDHCDCEYADNEEMRRNLELSFTETEKYKNIYKDKLIISRGIEIGEFLFNPEFSEKMIASYDFDVILGSVHAVRIKGWEMPFSVIDFSCLSDDFIDRYVTQYFNNLLETAINADYDILCHLTVVLRYIVYKYKKTVDMNKHIPVITEILKEVIKRDKTLEVNTSGIEDGYFMPDTDILTLYKTLGGRNITLGSDAHSPSNIAKGLNEGVKLLKMLGFNELSYYENRNRKTYKIQGL